MDIFKTVDNAIKRLIKVSIILLLILMVVCVTLQIVFRYFLAKPLAWSEELARYAFVWISFLAASLALDYNMHFGIDFFVGKFSDRVRTIIETAMFLLIIIFSAVLLFKGMEVVAFARMSRSSGLQLRMDYVFLAIPVSSLLYIYFSVKKIILQFFVTKSGEGAEGK